MSVQRDRFNNKFGVLMAMAGSAIGLGNMWRFPYLTAENGGAAFILLYIILMITISLPIFITEYLIGRRRRANAFSAFRKLGHPEFRLIGLLAITAAVFILSFYCVVGGWAVRYLFQACALKFESAAVDYSAEFASFTSSTYSPLLYTFIFLGMTAFVISKGVNKGIERFSKIMIMILFFIIILVAIRSVTLPGSIEGIRYLFVPDFSKVSAETLINALGQSFFSLGLGAGIIVIYGSYVKSEDDITITAVFTAALDTLFAVIAGTAIIPAVYAVASINGYIPDVNAGPGLVFITLPNIFASMPMGSLAAILFFSSLLLAAVTSSISLLESAVSFIIEVWNTTRRTAVIAGFTICALLGILCSLANGVLADVRVFGLNIFDFFDKCASNILMTGSGLLMVIFAGWIMRKKDFIDELSNNGNSKTPLWLIRTIYFLVKYAAPIGIIAIILGNILL